MKNAVIGLIISIISTTVWAKSNSGSNYSTEDSRKNESVTMQELNKALEWCKSLDHNKIKIDCADAAKACAGSKDMNACFEKEAR